MESIGRLLRETRERLGLTLEEVERATHIRVHHLKALEEGDVDSLPSMVHARGFLHNYAEFLGLDVDSVLLQFAEWLQGHGKRMQARLAYQEPVTRPSVQVRSRRPRWLSSDLFIATGITAAILAVLIWGGTRLIASLRENVPSTEQVYALLASAATPSPAIEEGSSAEAEIQITSPEAVQITATPTLSIFIGAANEVSLQLVIVKRAWLSVLVDNQLDFQGRAKPGDVLEYRATRTVEVTTGNGAGVRAIYNGLDQGLLGGFGQVVIRIWTLTGVQTPTPTSTPAWSPTPTETEAVIPTGTEIPPSPTVESTSAGG
jgi:cytoskeleton protein RodZ